MLDIQGIGLFNSFDSRTIVATLYCIPIYVDWSAYVLVADVSPFYYLEFG